ncbi:MAG: hypothetical protein PVG66_00405 [Chromatiales bacterium]
MNFSKQQHILTAWVLTASILLYPLLTYLATPTVKTSETGQLLVICTLQGEKQVYVDFGASPDGQASHDDFCPALELVKLAGYLYQPALPEPPIALFFSAGLLSNAALPNNPASFAVAYSSRAPPPHFLFT